MKKRSSSQKNRKRTVKTKRAQESVTIGMDLGDRTSRYCMLGSEGEILREGQVQTSKAGMLEAFGSLGRARIAIEVGTHSPWVSRLLGSFGHEIVVANPRQVKLITESSRKDDRLDAQTLARLARIDPQLLRPIQHRSETAQTALTVIRVRAALIAVRTSLVNTARGLAKAMGERLPKCDADQMGVLGAESLPAKLRQLLEPLLKEVESLTEKIKDSDREIEQIARKDYPETALLQQVGGVGPLIALTFVLTIDDKNRFQRSRDVGCYVGLRASFPFPAPSPKRLSQSCQMSRVILVPRLIAESALGRFVLSRRGRRYRTWAQRYANPNLLVVLHAVQPTSPPWRALSLTANC